MTKKSVKFQIEKISNGYLFTETKDEVEGKKTYNDKKSNFFDLLKEHEAVGEMIKDDDDMMLFEVIRHDINMEPQEKTNKELLEEVVQRDKFSPFKNTEINEEELRLSVTPKNCYSSERLKAIEWLEHDKELSLSIVRKAEISGCKKETFYSAWAKIVKGKAVFQSIEMRVYMTVLAKYYETTLGVRSSKKDELERISTGLVEQIDALNGLYKKNCLIDSRSLGPIMDALKNLIHI
jgi:hypothetical protein